MPLYGVLERESIRTGAVAVSQATLFHAPDLEVPDARVVRAFFEMHTEKAVELLPRGFRPTIPAMWAVLAIDVPTSPAGDFRIVLEQVMSRLGQRSRAYPVRGYVSSEPAAQFLREAWGLNLRVADVTMPSWYDRVQVQVVDQGQPALRCDISHTTATSADDLSLAATVTPVALDDGRLVLSQVEPEFRPNRVIRGRPALYWGEPPPTMSLLDLPEPAVGTAFDGDFRLPSVRFLLDPDSGETVLTAP
jgi:hypothetical protein